MRSRPSTVRQLRLKCSRVRMVIMDVDGVLTDGRIIYAEDGSEIKLFHAHDGYGIERAAGKGVKFVIVSGRSSKAVAKRARELGVTEIHQGVKDKAQIVRRVLARYGLRKDEVCYIGDDEPDRAVLRTVGFSAAPVDAMPELRRLVDYVAKSGGGRGAVREVLDLILKARGML